MNNMLYIIAGLVIVAIVAVLFLKKNKSPAQAPVRPIDNQPPAPSTAPANAVTPAASIKFDDLTVAQRFIDQQRYDRAIETLERGLLENPSNHQLRLKLLNIYALTKQPEEFYSTYQAIEQAADNAALNEAQELKDLFDAEQGHQMVATQADFEVKPEFESLDFDLGADHKKTNHQKAPIESQVGDSTVYTENLQNTPTTANTYSDAPSHDAPLNNEFDLTLEDLEASDFDFETPNNQTAQTPVVTDLDLQDAKDNAFNFDDLEKASAAQLEPQAALESQDEALSFDDIDALALNESASVEAKADPKAATLDDDNFDFDLDLDLNEAKDPSVSSANKPAIEDAPAAQEVATEDRFDDFALDLTELDDKTNSLSPAANVFSDELLLQAEQEDQTEPAKSENLADDDFAMFGLEEAAFDKTEAGSEFSPAEPEVVTQNDTLFFDDNTSLSIFEQESQPAAPEVSLPTELPTEAIPTPEPVTVDSDLSKQFAEDFDFVASFDPNQITLNLAEQYLELGEYDSAKRLLDEVVHTGDSQQQQQAQALLAKTA